MQMVTAVEFLSVAIAALVVGQLFREHLCRPAVLLAPGYRSTLGLAVAVPLTLILGIAVATLTANHLANSTTIAACGFAVVLGFMSWCFPPLLMALMPGGLMMLMMLVMFSGFGHQRAIDIALAEGDATWTLGFTAAALSLVAVLVHLVHRLDEESVAHRGARMFDDYAKCGRVHALGSTTRLPWSMPWWSIMRDPRFPRVVGHSIIARVVHRSRVFDPCPAWMIVIVTLIIIAGYDYLTTTTGMSSVAIFGLMPLMILQVVASPAMIAALPSEMMRPDNRQRAEALILLSNAVILLRPSLVAWLVACLYALIITGSPPVHAGLSLTALSASAVIALVALTLLRPQHANHSRLKFIIPGLIVFAALDGFLLHPDAAAATTWIALVLIILLALIALAFTWRYRLRADFD